ncbi:MAG: ribosome maturation factor RimM [Aquabacterium sp.]|nr:MAG: ribosome maturation factor RimM [Aquabacterium sp.]
MNAAPDPEALPPDAVEVGRIIDAWGIKGGIKVVPYSTDPQALFSTKRWYLLPPEEKYLPAAVREAGARISWPPLLRITQAKEHGDGIVAMVQEVNDRSTAEALKGGRIFVSRTSFPTASEDEFYWVDLIGLQVSNREGQELGTVSGLLDTGAHSVLRIADTTQGVERLIPFVGAYIDGVSLEQKRIVVDWAADWDQPAEPAKPAAQRTRKPR